ncbi:MAG: hypothetical protein WA996_19275 [Candidatus Promineifilaceae bacterium]
MDRYALKNRQAITLLYTMTSVGDEEKIVLPLPNDEQVAAWTAQVKDLRSVLVAV